MSEPARIQYKFMIPAELKSRLENAAHDKRRSLSAEIIARLEASLEGRASDGQPITLEALREESKKVEDLLLRIEAKLPSPKED